MFYLEKKSIFKGSRPTDVGEIKGVEPMFDTKKAELMLQDIFPTTGRAVKYIAAYRTEAGKEFALERKKRKSDDMPYYVWMQHEPPKIEGLAIQNMENPGKPYERSQRRTTGLSGRTAPSLMNGKRAFYVKVRDIEVLEKLALDYTGSTVTGTSRSAW